MSVDTSDDGCTGPELDDEELLDLASEAKNGRQFRLRFENSYDSEALQRRYDSRRQAEIALLANLAFWTGHDRQRMWRLFERSEQYRERLEKFPEYREELLDEAIELVDDECFGSE